MTPGGRSRGLCIAGLPPPGENTMTQTKATTSNWSGKGWKNCTPSLPPPLHHLLKKNQSLENLRSPKHRLMLRPWGSVALMPLQAAKSTPCKQKVVGAQISRVTCSNNNSKCNRMFRAKLKYPSHTTTNRHSRRELFSPMPSRSSHTWISSKPTISWTYSGDL